MIEGRRRVRGARGLALVVGALAGCGADDTTGASTVARAVEPPPIADTTTATPRHTVPAANAIDPPAGGGSAALEGDPPETLDAREPDAQSAAAAPRRILSAADRASFARLAGSLSGVEGLAVSGVGIGQPVERLGSLRTGIAWSTSKVPVAMAVIAAGGATTHAGDLRQAIAASDNAAAERLWSSLGGGAAAAGAADGQLRAAGDTTTTIESRQLRAGFTPFGQTLWSLTDHTRFTAGMACTEHGRAVLELMGQVVGGQRWGLGAAGVPSAFKGGWGPGSRPGAAGGYLDRQNGVLTIGGRRLAVSIATVPANGSHGTGTGNLTAIARWLVRHASTKALPRTAAC